jgi:hypothetical protein
MKNGLLFLIIAQTIVSSAQGQVPAAYQPAYNQMMKQQSFNNFQNFMMHMNYFGNGQLSDTKFFFKLIMKDSTKKEVKSFLFFDTAMKKTYIKLINKDLPKKDSNRTEKIYCTDVIELRAGAGSTARLLQGTITDSCWLFKTLTGQINVYSTYPEDNMNYSVTAIQLGMAKIEPFDPEKLKLIIVGNEKALKQFNKKNYFAAIEKFNDAKY